MPTPTDARPLLIDDLAALRRKLESDRSEIGRWWRHFRLLARHQRDALPMYSALVALVDPDDAEAARAAAEAIRRRVADVPGQMAAYALQYHTWCHAAPLARWAIYYDWLADHEAMAGDDHDAVADALLDAMWSGVRPVLAAREPSADNQQASMLLGCAVIGYLFGYRRGADPRARRLFNEAIDRYPDMIRLATPGFIGEGSGYIQNVNVPVLALWHALLDWLGLEHDPKPVLDALEMGGRIVGPTGEVLGWDHHGHTPALCSAGPAMLARETGDASHLTNMRRLGLWHAKDRAAWASDARLWSLVWMPGACDESGEDRTDGDDSNDGDERASGWSEPAVGATLEAPGRAMRAFVAWDECLGDPSCIARSQADAAALSLELAGVPLLVDGMADRPRCEAFDYDPERMLTPDERRGLEAMLALRSQVVQRPMSTRDRLREIAYGTVGGANALVLDQRPEHFPRGATHGRLTREVRLPGLSLVAADVTTFHRADLGLRRVQRTVAMIDDAYLLTLDEVEAERDIDVQWQVHTPPGATVNDGVVCAATEQGPAITIARERDADEPAAVRADPIDLYPAEPYGGSTRVSWSRRVSNDTLATLLAPSDGERRGELDTLWTGGICNDGHAADRYPDTSEPLASGAFEDVIEALAAGPADRYRWLRCRATPPMGAASLRLNLPNLASWCWCNGEAAAMPAVPEHAKERLLPVVLPTRGRAVMDMVIVTPPEGGRLLRRPGAWHAAPPGPPEASLVRRGEGAWTIETQGRRDALYTAAAAKRAGYDTDARWLMVAKECLWAIDATRVAGPGATPLRTEQPVHALWDGDRWTTKSANVVPPASDRPYADAFAVAPNRVAVSDAPFAPVAPLGPLGPLGRRLADVLEAEDVDAIAALLEDADWRIRCAAAERLGELGDPRAAPMLRRVLASELDAELYPPLAKDADARPGLSVADLGRRSDAKRYRLAQALLTALTDLADAEALPLARRALAQPEHFYSVHRAAIELLGRCGEADDAALLETWTSFPEPNCAAAARRAVLGLASRMSSEPAVGLDF